MRKVLLATCLGSLAALTAGAAIANDELIKMSQNPKDWVQPAGDYANTRYSKLNQITAANVGKLQVAWTYAFGYTSSAPVVVRGVLYGRGRNGALVAVDAATGKELWIRENMNGMTSRGCN